jgi:Lar family restriction alleviation protein
MTKDTIPFPVSVPEGDARVAHDGERRDTVSDLLLPCPFCGQKAYIRKRHHSMPRDPTYQAYCDDCGCGTSDLYRQPALAIQAWNQRALAEIEPAPSDGGER